jgi:prepilin peptidase CpaA
MIDVVQSLAFVALTIAAAATDLRTRRIPNVLTVSGFAVALALRIGLGWPGLREGLLGAGLALVISLVLLSVGAIAGGDAKLLIALGAFMGPERFFGSLLLIGVVGGLIGVGNAIRRGVIVPVVLNSLNMLKYGLTFGRKGYTRSLASSGAVTIPYGVAIAVGGLLGWFVGVPVR